MPENSSKEIAADIDDIKAQEKLDHLKLEILKGNDLFTAFPDSNLKLLIKHCKEIQLKDGETLCSEGEMENKMYIILSGQLLIYKLKRKIDVAGPGEHLGEMLLIDAKPRSATIKARGDVSLLEIEEETFKEHILKDAESLISMLETFCKRTRKNLEVISEDFQSLNIFVHDMRNILVGLDIPEVHIKSIAEILEGRRPGQKPREGFDRAKTSVAKLASVKSNLISLLEQSLAIADKDQSEYVRKPFCIKSLVEETAEELCNHKHLKGKIIETDCKEKIPEIPINYLDMKRVLQNLLINAGHASEKNQKIKVVVASAGNGMNISVIDQGSGIPDDVKPLLLKGRYTTKGDGNGYGLLSCRQIIEEYHQGRFWFESEEGKGAAFHLTIPNSIVSAQIKS